MDTETITAFLAIGSIIFLGFFGNFIFNRFRIPDVVILILLGMVIGPDLLGERFNLVSYEVLEAIDNFKSLFLSAALVVILFDAGMSMEMGVVLESMRLSAFISVMAFICTFVSIGVVLHLIMGMDILLALTLGAIVGGTSGAIVIPIVTRMRIKAQTKAMLVTESLITDVLVIVVALTMITVILTGDLSLVSITKDLASKFLVGGAVGFIAGVLWLFVLQRLQNQPLSYMITMAALFVVAGIVELPPISSSGAVAALTFGLALGNRHFVRRRLSSLSLTLSSSLQIQQFHSEITFFVRTFFFVYIGLFFRFDTFTGIHLVAGLLMISVIVLVRWLVSMSAWRVGDLGAEDAETVFASMPRGLAAAVMATLPTVMLVNVAGIWSQEMGAFFLNTTLIVILGTTILTTVLSFVIEKGIDAKQVSDLRKNLSEKNHV